MPMRRRISTPGPVITEPVRQATTTSDDNPLALTTLQAACLLGVARPTIFAAISRKRLSFYTVQSDREHVDKEYRITLSAALESTAKEHRSLMSALGNYLLSRSMYERALIDESTYQDVRRKLVVALVRVHDIVELQPLLEAIRTDYSSYLDDIFREVMGNG